MLLDIKISFSHVSVFSWFVKHEAIFSMRVINFYKWSALAWQCTTQAYTVLQVWLDKMSYVFREKNLQKKSQQQMQLCFQKRTQEYRVCTGIYTERDSKPILLYFSKSKQKSLYLILQCFCHGMELRCCFSILEPF